MIAFAALAAAAAVWVKMSSFALARARLARIPAIGDVAPGRTGASVVNGNGNGKNGNIKPAAGGGKSKRRGERGAVEA